MRFFIDACISPVITEAIQVLARIQKYEIRHLTQRFAADVKDVLWVAALAEEGDWVVVSADPRIARGRAEREAWRESGLTAFFFAEGFASKQFWRQAEVVVHWWPQIVLKARESPPGCGFLVPLEGKQMKQIFEP